MSTKTIDGDFMKLILFLVLSILTTKTFSAEIKTCKINYIVVKNVVVPSAKTTISIANEISSTKTDEAKIDAIKRILYIEGVSIGDEKSYCDLAIKTYKVDSEKCLRALRTDDIIEQFLVKNSDAKNLSLQCQIGLEFKVQLDFKM